MSDPDDLLPEHSSYDFLAEAYQDWPSGQSTFESYDFAVRDVDVTPDGLTDFARLVRSDADHHYTSWLHGASQATQRLPHFGDYSAGTALYQAYFEALSSLHKLMKDVGTGLTSLQQVANNIAEAYAGSDDASAVGFDSIEASAVGNAFGILERHERSPRPRADPYDPEYLRERIERDFGRLEDGRPVRLQIQDTELEIQVTEGSAAQDATQPTLDAIAEDLEPYLYDRHGHLVEGETAPENPSLELTEYAEED